MTNIVATNRTKLQPYKIYRADGSLKGIKCKSSVGTTNIVATDFNPLTEERQNCYNKF